MDLTIKNVIFCNSTLVTYTYIYKRKSITIYTGFLDVLLLMGSENKKEEKKKTI